MQIPQNYEFQQIIQTKDNFKHEEIFDNYESKGILKIPTSCEINRAQISYNNYISHIQDLRQIDTPAAQS